jgi:hypothetical protein
MQRRPTTPKNTATSKDGLGQLRDVLIVLLIVMSAAIVPLWAFSYLRDAQKTIKDRDVVKTWCSPLYLPKILSMKWDKPKHPDLTYIPPVTMRSSADSIDRIGACALRDLSDPESPAKTLTYADFSYFEYEAHQDARTQAAVAENDARRKSEAEVDVISSKTYFTPAN